jgi:psiF repeat
MRTFALVSILCLVAGSAFAQTSSCTVQATNKKLAGAALTSFMNKCKSDAQKSCDSAATSKKLAGAAKTSFMKKCVRDATGS